jgi:hypothetical protein
MPDLPKGVTSQLKKIHTTWGGDPDSFDAMTATGEGTFAETYPVVTRCPKCRSPHGYQSFDIWVCTMCNEWSGIKPTRSERTDGD